VVPPVETVLGESRYSGHRIEVSGVFPGAKYRHDSKRGSGRLEIVCPDSGIGRVLRLFGLKISEEITDC
jgi:hypothetical protein